MDLALFIRPDIELRVAPVRNPTFVTMSDGTVQNTYELRLRNKHGGARTFKIAISGDMALQPALEGSQTTQVDVPADATLKVRAYVSAPPGSMPAAQDETAFRIWVEDLTSGERAYRDTIFNGKGSDQ